MTSMRATTAEGFGADVRASSVPVLVDFWAAWCRQCRGMAPEIEELAARYEGRAKVVTVDVEAHPVLAEEHLVLSLPAIAIYDGGQVVRMLSGAHTADELGLVIEEVLG